MYYYQKINIKVIKQLTFYDNHAILKKVCKGHKTVYHWCMSFFSLNKINTSYPPLTNNPTAYVIEMVAIPITKYGIVARGSCCIIFNSIKLPKTRKISGFIIQFFISIFTFDTFSNLFKFRHDVVILLIIHFVELRKILELFELLNLGLYILMS